MRPRHSLVALTLIALVIATHLLSPPLPAAPSAPFFALAQGSENSLIQALGRDAELGPGFFVGSPSASPTIIRFTTSGVAARLYSLNVQNTGDSTLMLVKHSFGMSYQIAQVTPTTGTNLVVTLESGQSLQIVGLGDGTESRFIWSARKMV